MSTRSSCSPFPAADPLQPSRKARDVARSADMKRDAVEPPDVGARAPPGMMERLLNKCRIQNQLLRECLAEFLGVYVLIVSIVKNVQTCCVPAGEKEAKPKKLLVIQSL